MPYDGSLGDIRGGTGGGVEFLNYAAGGVLRAELGFRAIRSGIEIVGEAAPDALDSAALCHSGLAEVVNAVKGYAYGGTLQPGMSQAVRGQTLGLPEQLQLQFERTFVLWFGFVAIAYGCREVSAGTETAADNVKSAYEHYNQAVGGSAVVRNMAVKLHDEDRETLRQMAKEATDLDPEMELSGYDSRFYNTQTYLGKAEHILGMHRGAIDASGRPRQEVDADRVVDYLYGAYTDQEAVYVGLNTFSTNLREVTGWAESSMRTLNAVEGRISSAIIASDG